MPQTDPLRDAVAVNRLPTANPPHRAHERRVSGFLADRGGNIAILFAFMSTVLFLFVGGALDYTRWNSVRADMLESMDAASLAVAKLASTDDSLTDDQLKEYGEKFFKENFKQVSELNPEWSIEFDLSNKAFVSACVDGDLDTHLLGVAGIDTLDVDRCVEITKKGSGRIELGLVLDVTGSMGSGSKMQDLRDAVTALLDILFEGEDQSDNLKIGVIPFNQHINPGGAASWEASWGDLDADAVYHGARFFHVDEDLDVDMTTKVNHYRLFDSDPDSSWAGCVEARPYPLDELDTIPGESVTASYLMDEMSTPSVAEEPDALVRDAFADAPSINADLTLSQIASTANSRWVPQFLADAADCDNSSDCVYNNNGWVDGIHWYGYWFDDPDDDGKSESQYVNRNYIDDYRYTRYNSGAPFEDYVHVVDYFRDVLSGSASDPDFNDWLNFYRATSYGSDEYVLRAGYPGVWDPVNEVYEGKYDLTKGSGPGPNYRCPPAILALTDTRADVETKMDELFPEGTTNIPNGVIWGWRVVSPDAPFAEAVGEGETGPGGSQFEDWQKAVVIMTDGENVFNDRSTHWASTPSTHGYEIEERMGDNVDDADSGTPNMESDADNKVLRICRRMKQEDILVYTIVFDVNSGSDVENVFKSCATKPFAPYFFNAPDGEDLEDAFKDIAADLVDLHISK